MALLNIQREISLERQLYKQNKDPPLSYAKMT